MKQKKRLLFALPLMLLSASLPAMAATPWDGVFTGIFDSFTTGGVINVTLLTVAVLMVGWGVMQGLRGEDKDLMYHKILGGLLIGAVSKFVAWFQV